MMKTQLFVTLYISAMGAIECLNVSSKIAFEPEKRSLNLTSYASKPDLIEFVDFSSGPPTPSAFQQLNLNNIPVKCIATDDSPNTKKNVKNCQNGLCDFSTTTVRDSEGNLITTMKFSVITKSRDIKVEDIPVIDGFRGIYSEPAPPLTFPDRPNFSRNTQIHKQVPNFAPSFGPPKNYFLRPQTDSNGFARGIDVSHGQNSWMTERDSIDDKIPPPFSKTTTSVDAQKR